MSTLFASVRITTGAAAVWRTCGGCTVLAPLAPDQTRCRDCRRPAAVRRGNRRRLAA